MRGPEAQLAGPELHHLAGGPHASERQRRVNPRQQHELDSRRKVQQQRGDLAVAAAVPDHVIVIQHENGRRPQHGQLVEQQWQQCPREVRIAAPQRSQDLVAAEPGAGPLQRVRDMPPQPTRIVVGRIEGDPAKDRLSAGLDRHCATTVVFPKPAGAATSTSLALTRPSRATRSSRSTHSFRAWGA